jgi:hypothetical protein
MIRDLANVPASALTMAAETVQMQKADDGLVPIEMVARSNNPIEHWYWGNVIHDNESIKFKDVLPIDYLHEEEIGFLNEVEYDPERGVVCRGFLVMTEEPNDTARRLVAKSRGGIPYQASINFAGDGVQVREFAAGESVKVNGREHTGPLTVISNWPLRGVAVCPYGADGQTSSQFSNSQTFNLRGSDMPSKAKELAAEVVEAEETVVEVVETDELSAAEAVAEVVAEVAAEVVAEVVATEELTNPRAEARTFVEAFGEKGGSWYAEGLTFQQGQDRLLAELRAENETLKQKISAFSPDGEREAVGSAAGSDGTQKRGFASKIRMK